MESFKTPKGTVLPIMDLQGKPYLQVAYRVLWFREEHPEWLITSLFVKEDERGILAQANILDENSRVRAMAHAYIEVGGNKSLMDLYEKAETAAIGRALSHLGYGTQFTGGEEKIADGPVAPAKSAMAAMANIKNHAPKAKPVTAAPPTGDNVGGYVVTFGKHKGKELRHLSESEAIGFRDWLISSSNKDGKPLNAGAQEYCSMVDQFFKLPPTNDGDQIPF